MRIKNVADIIGKQTKLSLQKGPQVNLIAATPHSEHLVAIGSKERSKPAALSLTVDKKTGTPPIDVKVP